MTGHLHDGGTGVVGVDRIEEKKQQFCVGMLGKRPATADKGRQAEVLEGVAQQSVVLVAGAGKDGDVVERAVGMRAEPVERDADSFPDFGGFAGTRNDGDWRLEIGDWRFDKFVAKKPEPIEEWLRKFVTGGEEDRGGSKSLDQTTLSGIEIVKAVEED